MVLLLFYILTNSTLLLFCRCQAEEEAEAEAEAELLLMAEAEAELLPPEAEGKRKLLLNPRVSMCE